MSKYSWNGFTPNGDLVDFKEKFDIIYNDDGNLYLISKETFKQEADGDIPAYEYKYGIRVNDAYTYGKENGHKLFFEMLLCPLPKYYCEKKLAEYRDVTCWNGVHVSDYDLRRVNYDYYSMIDAGLFSVLFAWEEMEYDPADIKDSWYDYFYNLLESEDVVEMLNTMATVLQPIDSFYGFTMDKYANRIGSTNLDLLKEILLGIDSTKAAMERWKKQYGK